MFFHYFSSNGEIDRNVSVKDVNEVLTAMRKFGKSIYGLWGVLSLLLENKNGIEVFKMVNSSAYYNHSCSVACVQDANFEFSEEIKVSLV